MKNQEGMRIVFNALMQLQYWGTGSIHPSGPWTVAYITKHILWASKKEPTQKQLNFVRKCLNTLVDDGVAVRDAGDSYRVDENYSPS